MLKDMTLEEYINAVDSAQAAPGGGSVCGLCGALAVALIRMYGHLSVHKKAFLSQEQELQYLFIKRFSLLEIKKDELLTIVDADKEAYETFMNAYRMQKEQNNEETAQLLKEATLQAIQVPMQCMALALDAMKLAYDLVSYGNRMVLSDLMIGVIYLEASMRASRYNVQANFSGLESSEQNDYTKRMDVLMKESHSLYQQIEEAVYNRLK